MPTIVTLVGASTILAMALAVVGLLVWDVFLVLLVPFLALGVAGMRPLLHWALFALIAAATVFILIRIEEEESSTAGFGVVVIPALLTVAVLLAAAFDRLFDRSARGLG
jgi:hypothetical protein